MRNILHFLPRLWANWITLLGSVLTTISGLAILLFMLLEMTSVTNPYFAGMGIVVLPVVFVVGLLLIPLGLVLDRWRRQRRKITDGERQDLLEEAFSKALLDRKARTRILFVAFMTVINVLLFGGAAKATIEYADSPKFCGLACHSVMQPEWETYNRSPHANVACVQCHIGPGTVPEVKAKVNGIHQMYGLLVNSFDRPIPTPVANFRSANETCTNCHWPDRWSNNKLKLYPHYKDDKDNTPAFDAQFIHIGGRNPATGKYQGIHRHNDPDLEIKYEYLDPQRRKVGTITVLEKGSVTAVYEPKGDHAKALGVRTMDCIDCHSRPTHIEEPSAAVAVDHALFDGRLDPKIPYLKQVATEALGRVDLKPEEVSIYFTKAVGDAYGKHPDAAVTPDQLEASARAIAEIYRHNIFPDMKVVWGTYRNNVTHDVEGDDAAGCFRCHDGERKAKLADGTTRELSQECSMCHEQVANEDSPAKFDGTLKAILTH